MSAADIQKQVDIVMGEAKQACLDVLDPGVSDEVLGSHIQFEALVLTERRRQLQEAVQAQIVHLVVMGGLWASYPADPSRYPGGFECAGDFINEAFVRVNGHSRSRKSRLHGVAKVTQFAKQGGIDTSDHVGEWQKYKAALPALKRAVDEGDLGDFEAILDDVQHFKGREEIADKYSQRTQEQAGKATFRNMGDGSFVLVAIINHDGDRERVVSRLSGLLEWGLDARATTEGDRIKVTIEPENIWEAELEKALV